MKIDTKETAELHSINLDILAERTHKTKKWWEKEIEYKDKFYNQEQAVKLGIVNNEGDDFGWDIG